MMDFLEHASAVAAGILIGAALLKAIGLVRKKLIKFVKYLKSLDQ